MKFPKQVMSTQELKKMGIPNSILASVRADPRQTIAFQMVKNGIVWWDTEKLSRYLEKRAVRY